MKSIYKNLIFGFCAGAILLTSCKEDEDTRVVYPHSTPVIESATINPSSFVYGDSVTIVAKVSDSKTPLSTLNMKMIVNDVLIAEQTVRTPGNSTEISSKFKVTYTSQLPDNANVEVLLTLVNVEGDETKGTIDGIKGNRTYYDKLYLVLDNGKVYPLVSGGTKSDQYKSDEIMIKSNKVRYKIAEKITADNQIDFSGTVWGYKGGTVKVVDETGDYITTTNAGVDYVTTVVFDNYQFEATLTGSKYNPNDLILDTFEEVKINNESFKKLSRLFEKNQEITLFGDLASSNIVFNMDYFERLSEDKIKFKGESGSYTLYYSSSRSNVIVDPAKRSFPDILLVPGIGLGYPSKVKPETHTKWDFNVPLDAIIFTKVAADTYQATVYLDAENANFKPFETSFWGNEKKSTDFTMPAIIAKDTDLGKTDGNWYAAPGAVSGNYKITINLATKVVTADSVTLP